jgi:endonuclease/exonuclease/phosphatase family metal-dependent hydrolase
VRLVCLNAWGGRLWPAMARELPRLAPDILCLQEVTRAPEPCPDWLIYEDAERRLEQRADLLTDVSALFPRHLPLFAAAMRGRLRSEAGAAFASDHGNAVWVAPRLAVTETLVRFVHGAHRPDGWGEPPAPRPIQVLRIAVPDHRRSLVLGHLHGLRDPAGKADTPARLQQTEAVIASLRLVRRPGDPVVLAGDLNLLPSSATFGMLAAEGLSDLVTARGFKDTRTSHYRKPGRFADYLLVSPEVQVEAFDVPAEPELSDHRPLVLDFAL